MGAKLFIGTPEMLLFIKIFVCTMKKCMVSIATINTIFEHGHVHKKFVIYPLLFILDH